MKSLRHLSALLLLVSACVGCQTIPSGCGSCYSGGCENPCGGWGSHHGAGYDSCESWDSCDTCGSCDDGCGKPKLCERLFNPCSGLLGGLFCGGCHAACYDCCTPCCQHVNWSDPWYANVGGYPGTIMPHHGCPGCGGMPDLISVPEQVPPGAVEQAPPPAEVQDAPMPAESADVYFQHSLRSHSSRSASSVERWLPTGM